jgi:hypothetical protein
MLSSVSVAFLSDILLSAHKTISVNHYHSET